MSSTTIERPMCEGFNVQAVYTDLPNDRFQQVMMLSKAGRRRRFAAAPSRFRGLLAGVFSAPIHGRLGIPADVPALKFALQVRKAFVIRPFPKIGATRSTHLRWQVQPPFAGAHPKRAHAPSPSRFQSLSPCGQFSNVTIPSNLFCAGHGKARR